PHRGPVSACDPSGDAGHRDAGGHRARRQRWHLRTGRSLGPYVHRDRAGARSRRGRRPPHKRRGPVVRALGRLGRNARRADDPRPRGLALEEEMDLGARAVRVGVDVGGTFTDLVAIAEDGEIAVRKVATTPSDPSVGLGRALDAVRGAVDVLVHGTTVATNALLERRGARVVLVTTVGFEDVLWLRRQDRAALYDLARDHPPPLVARDDVIGAAERMGPEGPLLALTDAAVTQVV